MGMSQSRERDRSSHPGPPAAAAAASAGTSTGTSTSTSTMPTDTHAPHAGARHTRHRAASSSPPPAGRERARRRYHLFHPDGARVAAGPNAEAADAAPSAGPSSGPPSRPPSQRTVEQRIERRISTLIGRRLGGGDDDAASAKRERSASSSVHHQSPGRPVPKRRRVGVDGQDDECEELDGAGSTAQRNGLDLDLAPAAGPSRHIPPFASFASSAASSGRSTPLSFAPRSTDEAPAAGLSGRSHPPRPPLNASSFHRFPPPELAPRSPRPSGLSTPNPVAAELGTADPPAMPTDELLADRLRTISTIRDALGSDWTPTSSSTSVTSGGGLFSRFRRRSQHRPSRPPSTTAAEDVERRLGLLSSSGSDRQPRPSTPSLSSGSTAGTTSSTTSAPARAARSFSHRLSAIMGFGTPARGDDADDRPPSRSSTLRSSAASAAAAPIAPQDDGPASSGEDPTRIPVGAVLVIQGLAQTHANLEDSDPNGIMPGTRTRRLSESAIDATRAGLAAGNAAGVPARPRIDVASLDQQARMIGNLLTVAAAATATTLLSPTSLAPQQSRTTAHSAMQTILERFRPQRSRASQSIESTLGEYLRTVLRDNRRFAEAVAGDATSGNMPSEFHEFLQTLQQDLILAVRAYAVPEDEDSDGALYGASASGSGTASESDAGAGAWPRSHPMSVDEDESMEPPSRAGTPTPSSSAAAESATSPTTTTAREPTPIPTFHNQRGQNLPGSGAARLGVSGGWDGVPRRLNFFRAHLFPSVSNGGERAADDDANAMVPSIFVGVRSVTHDPTMTTEDLVGHPGFPFLDGQVPDGPGADGGAAPLEPNGDFEQPAFDRDLERELGSPPTSPSSLPSALGAAVPTPGSPRRTLRDRVRERFNPRRESRAHTPLNTYLIYVIGGNYPRSHPVLAIPSLVSGGPLTAEDLALVSELLGPAKPPTASADEINRSGLAVVSGKDMDALHARGEVLEASLERCMVCLGDYEPEEECRVLKCRHAFHKECVDHWLSQGRNSCPACRTEAVDKNALGSAAPAEPVGADAPRPAESVA